MELQFKTEPKILIVDDEEKNRKLMEAQLVANDYKVISAKDGEEALDLLASEDVDIVLMDVMMPGIDGFEVTRRIRADEKNKFIAIVLVTALDSKEDRIKGIEAGCDDFISKPYEKNELNARVKTLCETSFYRNLLLKEKSKLLKEAHKELFQAEKMASMGILSATIVHQIRNPLQIILMGVQTLKRLSDSLPGQALKILTMMEEAATDSDAVIKGLLKFSRTADIEVGENDLVEVIEGTIEMTRIISKKRGIEINFENLAQSKLMVESDKTLIQQVLFNLIDNAVDASEDEAEIKITGDIEEDPVKGRQVVIRVSDCGSGMPEEVKEKIFDPFFTTKREGKGTGLGLSMVYKIVHLHKGKISIESFEGKGTTFIINLPMNKGDKNE